MIEISKDTDMYLNRKSVIKEGEQLLSGSGNLSQKYVHLTVFSLKF